MVTIAHGRGKQMSEIVRRYFDKLTARDQIGLEDLFTKGADISFKGIGDYAGPLSAARFAKDFYNSFPAFTPLKITLIETGNHVGVECMANGKVATDKEFSDIGFAHFFILSSGRIKRLTVYADMPGLRAQVGKW